MTKTEVMVVKVYTTNMEWLPINCSECEFCCESCLRDGSVCTAADREPIDTAMLVGDNRPSFCPLKEVAVKFKI